MPQFAPTFKDYLELANTKIIYTVNVFENNSFCNPTVSLKIAYKSQKKGQSQL